MNAKEKAKELWAVIRAWGVDRIKSLSFAETVEIGLDPEKKKALLDEESVYAESIIAEALAEKEAEIVRLITVICLCVKALYQAIEIAPLDRIPPMAGEAIQEAQATLNSLLPPDEKKEEP